MSRPGMRELRNDALNAALAIEPDDRARWGARIQRLGAHLQEAGALAQAGKIDSLRSVDFEDWQVLLLMADAAMSSQYEQLVASIVDGLEDPE